MFFLSKPSDAADGGFRFGRRSQRLPGSGPMPSMSFDGQLQGASFSEVGMSELVRRADAFAARAHGAIDQRRKYTGEPYIAHPRAVAALVREAAQGDETIAAALLHDVVEDTPVTLSDVRAEFGGYVAQLVDELTDRASRAIGNRAARKRWEAGRLAKASAPAKTVKVADLIDNAASIVRHDPGFAKVYLAEMQQLLGVLEGADRRLLARGWNALEYGWRALMVA
jgi:(p)ppGpp synthase/HD superfamily hydrolase